MSHTPECRQEIFYNNLGSTGAIVCSCGFAVTFTRLGDAPERSGRKLFALTHEQHHRLTAAATEMLAALRGAEIALVNCIPVIPYSGDGPLVSIRAAIAEASDATA